MNKIKRAIILLTLVMALMVGVATSAFATDEIVPDADGTNGEVTQPDEGTDAKDDALADALAALEAKTPLKQYDLPVINGPYTWESGTNEVTAWRWSGNTATTTWGQILNRLEGINDIGVEEVEPGNSAFTVRYNGEKEKEYEAANGGVHSYAYYNIGSRNTANDLVIEFDITSFGDKYPEMSFEHSSVSNDSGGRSQPVMLRVAADGTLTPALTGNNCKSGHNISAEEKENFKNYKLKIGEWTHVSLIYESQTCFVTLYIDYQYVARFDTRPSNVSYYDISIFRFGTSNPNFISGEFSIDNYIAYEGSYIRTVDLFEKMTEPDRFVFYSGYLLNADASVSDRVAAYKYATNLLDEYYEDETFVPFEDGSLTAEELAELNAKLEAAVNNYLDFVGDENGYALLYNDFITDNLTAFGTLVTEFRASQDRTIASISNRNDAINNIEKFLNGCGDDILQTADSDYVRIKAEYDKICAELENDKNIVTFCDKVDRFYKSVSFSAETLQKHYQAATEAYMNIYDRSVVELAGFERFAESLELYKNSAAILEDKYQNQNAKTIVDCIGFINGYTTVEEWNANYEYINKYVVIVRNVVRENRYNTLASGVAEALEFFNIIDGYFYDLLQQEHGAYILALLETYRNTDSFVEKSGICAHLDAYIASVDIDPQHSAVKEYILTLNFYKDELKTYEADYREVLAQNTIMFKNAITLMTTAETYTELCSLYNQARELYFAMNVGDDSIVEELAIYDEMTQYLARVERASADFILAVEALRLATTTEEKYAALVQCYIYAADAEVEVDGVANAMAFYLAEYEAYNSGIDTTITEINKAVDVSVANVRASSGVQGIIAVIVKKIGEQ